MSRSCPRCSGPLNFDGGCVAHGEPSVALAVDQAASLQRERQRRRAAVKWTPEHWAYAQSLMGTLSGPEIARALTERFGIRRTWKSVKHQFERRKVSKPEVRSAVRVARDRPHWSKNPARSRWEPAEDAALEDGELTNLGRGRSYWAKACRAYRLGTAVRSGDGAMSLRQVSEKYGVDTHVIGEWINRGLLPATRSGRMYRIDPVLAQQMVPGLKRLARHHTGQRGWWRKPAVENWVALVIEEFRALESNVDDLLRPGLVRSEE